MQNVFKCNRGCDLSFALHGSSRENILVVQHGMVASIRDVGLFEPLLLENISVLLIARPGYGDSNCYQLSNVYEYCEIVNELLNHLNITRVSVLGSSSGAPYSLALASGMPNRVHCTFIFSGIPQLTDPHIAALWPYPIEHGKTVEYFQEISKNIFGWMKTETAKNRHDILDTIRHDFYGPALDLKIRGEDWGFSLEEIKGTVIFEHGLHDEEIAYEAARLTSLKIPNARMIPREHGGHFSTPLFQEFLKSQVITSMKY